MPPKMPRPLVAILLCVSILSAYGVLPPNFTMLIFILKEADSMQKIRNNEFFFQFLKLSNRNSMAYWYPP